MTFSLEGIMSKIRSGEGAPQTIEISRRPPALTLDTVVPLMRGYHDDSIEERPLISCLKHNEHPAVKRMVSWEEPIEHVHKVKRIRYPWNIKEAKKKGFAGLMQKTVARARNWVSKHNYEKLSMQADEFEASDDEETEPVSEEPRTRSPPPKRHHRSVPASRPRMGLRAAMHSLSLKSKKTSSVGDDKAGIAEQSTWV